RAGRAGTAITLVAPADRKAIAAIEKLTGQTIGWSGRPAADSEAPARRTEARGAGGRSDRSGKRGGHRSDKRERAPAPVARIEDVRRGRDQRRDRDDTQPHLPAFLLRPFGAKA